MDGRRFRLWLCSGLLMGGAVGCTRQQTQPGGVQVTPLKPPGQSSSFFSRGSSASPPANASQPLPPELVKQPSGKPKEWSADTIVAFANVRAEMALAEDQTPAQREQLSDQARQAYQKALVKDSKNKGALLGLARLYAGIGEKERAIDMYRRYLTVSPKEHEIVHEVALAYARWKDWAGAAAWCQQALTIDPENRPYRKTLGFCLARGGEWEKGFAILCQIMPETQARYDMACVLAHVGQAGASRQQLTLALQADPNFAPARDFLANLASADTPTPKVVVEPNAVQAAGYQQPTPGR